MDRDRVNALLASVGDEPHWQVCRQLLDEHDKAVASRDIWRETAAKAGEQADALAERLAKVEEDSVRLAHHIISNPSGDFQRVLNLHDRRYE